MGWHEDTEPARAASSHGRHEEALTRYREILATTGEADPTRIHVLCGLANAERLAARPGEALATAREAVTTAIGLADTSGEAHARLLVARILLDAFDPHAGATPDSEAAFHEAMAGLDRAAAIYERAGSIDFFAVLLMIGEALCSIGEFASADPLFARVAHELTEAWWTRREVSALPAADLRTRAFVALAQNALRAGGDERARECLETAAELAITRESFDPLVDKLLESIIELVRHGLRDPVRADELAAMAAGR